MRYLVKARSKTAVHVEKPQVFDMPDAKVAVTNWTVTDAAGAAHRGLYFDALVDAGSVDEALEAAMAPVHFVLALLCFAMAAGGRRIEILAAFHEEGEWCEVVQFTELPLGPFTRRILNPDRIVAMLSELEQVEEDDRRERIQRAMAWYQRSAVEENPLDQFSAAWLGLEVLNPILKSDRDLPDEEPGRACPNCGSTVMMKATSAGIRDLLMRVGAPDLWKSANRRRVALQHGTEPFRAIHEGLPALADQVRHALRLGILEIAAAKADRVLFDHKPVGVPQPHRASLHFSLRGLRLDQVPAGQNHPRLELQKVEGERRRDSEGRTNEDAATEWRLVNFTGEWRNRRIAIATFKDPEDVKASVRIVKMSTAERPSDHRTTSSPGTANPGTS